MSVKIKKAKIKEELFLEVEYSENLPGHNRKDTKLSSTVPIHEDLKTAFQALDKHLAILCDEVSCPTSRKKLDEIDVAKFTSKGFSISSSGDDEGCVVFGAKVGAFGIVNLVTPFTKHNGVDYKWSSDLGGDIASCVYEVEQYLFHGKRAPEVQMEMQFDEDFESM